MGKVARDETLQAVNERLREIRDAIAYRGGKIYGFHINSGESDPEEAVTYLMDAVGMTPARMDYTNGVFSWGSWYDAFFIPRPCMLKFDGTVDYYLNPNNYGKKYGSNASSDVGNENYGGNAMMEWGRDGKKIWYKIVPDSDPTSASVYIADHQADSDFRAWSFINNQGELVDHFYTPIYNGSKDGNNRLRSLSGKAIPAISADQARACSRANNSGIPIWDMEVYCDVILINLLLTLMCKSLDTQTAFGNGVTLGYNEGGPYVIASGTGDTLGLFFGYSDTAHVVKVFGMENWWGNVWRRIAGLVVLNGTVKYKLTRGVEDGSAAGDYLATFTPGDYAGYLQGRTLTPFDGYIKKMIFNKYTYVPYEDGGSASTYYCDSTKITDSVLSFPVQGGPLSRGDGAGGWCLGLYSNGTEVSWPRTASPSCKPLSTH